MTYEIDGDQVVQAASQFAGTPFNKLSNAYNGAKNATLNPLAFGLIGSAIVGGKYEESRSHWENELKGGVDKWIATVNGLNKVAQTHDAAESATIINGPKMGRSSSSASTDGGSTTTDEAVVLGVGWTLAAENIAVAGILDTAAVMAPVAIAASIGWAAFSPLDDDLNQATGLWEAVHRSLDTFSASLEPGMGVLDAGWPQGQPSRTAFDNFMFRFGQEVADATTAAEANKTALDDLKNDLTSTQQTFLIEAAAALAAMIAAQVCVAIPVVGAAFEAIVEVIGGTLAAATAGTLAIIVNALYASFQALGEIAGHASFAEPAPASDDHPAHFTDVRIDWDRA